MTRRIAGFAVLMALTLFGTSQAGIVTGLTPGDFTGASVEAFDGPYAFADAYDFGNGMVHRSLTNVRDHVNYTGYYGLIDAPSVSGGRDGLGSGFFGTGSNPQKFEFRFAAGIDHFGFYGAEALSSDGSYRDGLLHLAFFDLQDDLIDSVIVDTRAAPAWEQFHGFASDAGLIGRVEFGWNGDTVLDDVTFGTLNAAVPEPASLVVWSLLAALAGWPGSLRPQRKRRSHQAFVGQRNSASTAVSERVSPSPCLESRRSWSAACPRPAGRIRRRRIRRLGGLNSGASHRA